MSRTELCSSTGAKSYMIKHHAGYIQFEIGDSGIAERELNEFGF